MKKLSRSLVVSVLALALPLAACSTNSGGSSSAAKSETAAASDKVINIVTSTPIWADVSKVVADSVQDGTQVKITSLITDPNVDPHHFEPSAADIARAQAADIVVVGGGGYDAWLYQGLKSQDNVVNALPLVAHDTLSEHASESKIPVIDGNEHIWYNVKALDLVGEGIASAINKKDANAQASAKDLEAKTSNYTARLAALPTKKYAQSEPIADYLLAPTPWKDVTPEGYRDATLDEGEPSAADLARFLDLIKSKGLDILIYNPQTETDLSQRIYDAAKEAGLPIVEIGETPVDGQNFFSYYDSVISALEAAAKK